MKLTFLKNLLLIILIVPVFATCKEETTRLDDRVESDIFIGVAYDPNLGVSHNGLLDEWFGKYKTQLKGKQRSEKFAMVEGFFIERYSIDVGNLKYKMFNLSPSVSNARINNTILNFDPYLVINNNRNRMTGEVYESLNTLFSETERINTIANERRFLSSFENQILRNSNLSTSEKNGLRNMINVYSHSAEYWNANMENWGISPEQPSLNISNGIPRDAWQKIAWADIIEGAAGGF